jgi:predicted membrane metal-binding protein
MRAVAWITVVEIVAFVIGLLLWHFAAWPWWTCLLALIVPPVIVIVILFFAFASSTANGGNPFQ